MPFVHLHTHSEYSLLDGANRIPDLVAHVKKLGMDSLAVTDHGNLHAAWSFYEEAKAQKIRPILGFEAYLAFGPRQAQREAVVGAGGLQPPGPSRPQSHRVQEPGPAHLDRVHRGVLPAPANRQGRARRALPRASCAWRRVSRARSSLHLRQGKYDEAKKSAEWFARTFGPDGFWLEIQQHGIPEERLVAEGMLRLGKELGLGVVATNDAHYLRREDAEAHDVLLAIGTGSDLDDPKRFRFTGQESYVKSEKEMRALFPDQPEALANTARRGRRSASSTSRRSTSCRASPAPPEYASDEALLDAPRARGRGAPLRRRRCRPRSPNGWTTSSASSRRRATPATS